MSQGKVKKTAIYKLKFNQSRIKILLIFSTKTIPKFPFLSSVQATPFQGQAQSVLSVEFHQSIFGQSKINGLTFGYCKKSF